MELHLTDKMQTLSATLSAQMQKDNELDVVIKINFAKIGYKI